MTNKEIDHKCAKLNKEFLHGYRGHTDEYSELFQAIACVRINYGPSISSLPLEDVIEYILQNRTEIDLLVQGSFEAEEAATKLKLARLWREEADRSVNVTLKANKVCAAERALFNAQNELQNPRAQA